MVRIKILLVLKFYHRLACEFKSIWGGLRSSLACSFNDTFKHFLYGDLYLKFMESLKCQTS